MPTAIAQCRRSAAPRISSSSTIASASSSRPTSTSASAASPVISAPAAAGSGSPSATRPATTSASRWAAASAGRPTTRRTRRRQRPAHGALPPGLARRLPSAASAPRRALAARPAKPSICARSRQRERPPDRGLRRESALGALVRGSRGRRGRRTSARATPGEPDLPGQGLLLAALRDGARTWRPAGARDSSKRSVQRYRNAAIKTAGPRFRSAARDPRARAPAPAAAASSPTPRLKSTITETASACARPGRAPRGAQRGPGRTAPAPLRPLERAELNGVNVSRRSIPSPQPLRRPTGLGLTCPEPPSLLEAVVLLRAPPSSSSACARVPHAGERNDRLVRRARALSGRRVEQVLAARTRSASRPPRPTASSSSSAAASGAPRERT